MKRLWTILVVLSLVLPFAAACADPAQEKTISWTTSFSAHFATVEEGQKHIRNRTRFHAQINGRALAFFLQKKDGTLEEYIEYSEQQVLPFMPDEEKLINDTLLWLHNLLESHGMKLPDPGTLIFVKTTGKEALGAGGYTNEGIIFLTEGFFTENKEKPEAAMQEMLPHEIFHCLTRRYPEFRKAMYALIHFSVLDEEIAIPEEIKAQLIANPDVEHHNSYAPFTIGGVRKDCYLVFLTDAVFEKPGDSFFDSKYTGIVPLGESVVYRIEDTEDFWDVVGRNTDYAEDPEELMATNFSFALLWLDRGSKGQKKLKDPELLEKIIQYLKK